MERFDAPILDAPRGGAYVEVPAEIVAALGGKGRIPVHATFDGIAYRGSIVPMGGDSRILGVLKAIRGQLAKSPGDTVTVTLEADTSERTIVVPDDLKAALGDAGVADAFNRLSYSHQREYVTWVGDAKKPETRARRVSETIDRLRSGPR